MHIIGLVDDPDSVSPRYRLAAFQPYLEAEGHRLELQPIPNGFWSRLKLWRSLRQADVVILQRRLLSSWNLSLVRRYARRFIFDFDDAVFGRSSYSRKGVPSSVRFRRFLAALHAADVIVTGNDYLKEQAARFANLDRIHVIPTCIDARPYPLAKHERTQHGTQLVWIGCTTTLRGLECGTEVLETIGRQLPGISCKIICDRFPQLKELQVLPVPWSREFEVAELSAADIGISWVPDDEWSKGKCGLKLLQYMAAGLPVVANPVGVQATLVRHGENGYLAETPRQWVEAIRRLAANPEVRERLGRNGRRLVEREYGVARGAEMWVRLLQSLAPEQTAKVLMKRLQVGDRLLSEPRSRGLTAKRLRPGVDAGSVEP